MDSQASHSSSPSAFDQSTEERIKSAARSVFMKKGFAASRTRDIALESGINLALINYYFKSKSALFELIMMETMRGFFQSMLIVFNDNSTSLEEKIERIAQGYISVLLDQPDIPIFLLNELRNDPTAFVERVGMNEALIHSHFNAQLSERCRASNKSYSSLHLMINLMSLVMFPFVGKPVLQLIGKVDNDTYQALMKERIELIPKWILGMI